jgi:deoxyadenosine/deoxycytidine kinase
MPDARYLVIEGVIGVGKTSLATRLAEHLAARPFLEEVDENPFLAKFYAEPRSYAFSTQLFFLLSRYRQQQELSQLDLFGGGIVADYLFAKDKIFAYVNLDENELKLYEKVLSLIEGEIIRPDLVVYLQAPTSLLLKRIRERARPYETHLSPEYLNTLNEAYNYYFFHYNESPLLVVNVQDIDFVNDPDDFADLARAINNTFSGTRYYVPSSHHKA